MLLLQQQYQDKDDLALCHLKYGLAQAYKSVGKNEKCQELLEGVREAGVFHFMLAIRQRNKSVPFL